MIKNLIVGCSLLFVMCCKANDDNFVNKESNDDCIRYNNPNTMSDITIKEITVKGQKYILVVGYNSASICPSKNE